MRWLIRLFLTLCFLLLRGYGHWDVRASQSRTCQIRQPIPTRIVQSGKENGSPKREIADIEEDEDEDTSFRKYIIPGFYLDFLTSELPGHSNLSLNDLPCCIHLSYYSSFKYIVHRSIRV